MPVEFKLPDLGEGIHEGEIIEVLVRQGDRVEDGQTVLVIETDKATAEIPSPVTGTVGEIRVKPGQTVSVGEVLMVFLREGETGEEAAAPPPKTPGEERETRPSVAKGKRAEALAEKARETKPEPAAAALPAAPAEGPVPAAPSTRRLARELGVDINKVKPTGPGGRVTPEDVKAFAEKSGRLEAEKVEFEAGPLMPPAPVPAAPPLRLDLAGQVERIPFRSVRRTTAQHLSLAWSQIPHVTHSDVADITELEAFRREYGPRVEARGGALSITVLAMKAAAAALKKFPRFNSSLDLEAGEIVIKHYYNIGFAVDTERGLLVSVIRDVDRKSIFDLSVELRELAEKTRQGSATREDMSGGTFTITNVGPMGGTGFSPIINYPEVAILGLAKARLQPVVIGDQSDYKIVPRLMLPMNVTFDHRVLDGAEAARFLNMIIEGLENPENLLMMI